jgi:hypothetical protein
MLKDTCGARHASRQQAERDGGWWDAATAVAAAMAEVTAGATAMAAAAMARQAAVAPAVTRAAATVAAVARQATVTATAQRATTAVVAIGGDVGGGSRREAEGGEDDGRGGDGRGQRSLRATAHAAHRQLSTWTYTCGRHACDARVGSNRARAHHWYRRGSRRAWHRTQVTDPPAGLL